MYSDRRGTDKNHHEQNFQTKDFLKKNQRTIEREFVQRVFVRVFCTRPTKNGGSEMCDVLWGVPGCVTEGGGVKIGQK